MDKTIIENGFYIIRFVNENENTLKFQEAVSQEFIQFHFCQKGAGSFEFNEGTYQLPLMPKTVNLLYNPSKPLPINLKLSNYSSVVSLVISIKKFHGLFSEDADHIHFLSPENNTKKYYDTRNITPAMSVVLSQILEAKIHESIKPLYFKGKVYELLSLFFNKNEDTDVEQCPFLVDEENVRKIRKAKEIILNQMTEPPTLQGLASEIGLNVKKLKEGFKQIYGETVFGYLLDFKMNEARSMLDTKQYNVNEISIKLGYSTSSHFISAFKKKFGTTPKKYLMSVSS
ncbi:MAG: AraC family transcriptional regulator [Flavobacteriaceae bacterium]|jgi:AraC-like DNA-binding protein|nr:AraC family transcriptional regulator [Flavobacteriaceae bacterium]|tara:strand:- start:229 stop:1086 length:858 start_codon:yes stop_codon:yes gene_type:complete